MRGLLFFFVLFGCLSNNESQSEGEIINVDYENAVEIGVLDIVKDVSFIQLDTTFYLRHEAISRIVINEDRVAVLQSGALCSCADFVLFDKEGNHIKTINGFHDGNHNFAFATDMTYNRDTENYVILSLNPNKVVSIDRSGEIVGESILPLKGLYMDFFYLNDRYLFFSDNAMVSDSLVHNIVLTDTDFNTLNKFDPISEIQMRGYILNKDKIFYDHQNDKVWYLPSPLLDSIYWIDSRGGYDGWGKIEKTQNFSRVEMDNIIKSKSPLSTAIDMKRNGSDVPIIINSMVQDDYLFIPSSYLGRNYISFHSLQTGNNQTFVLDRNIIFHRVVNNSQTDFFIPISSYSFLEIMRDNTAYLDQHEKGKKLLAFASSIKETDNFILVRFRWNTEFMKSKMIGEGT